MAKLSITAAPTFKATVQIPVPGARPAPVEFVFRTKTRPEFKDFMESLDRKESDAEVICEIASGWDLAEPFDKENVAELCDNYLGAARAVLETYFTTVTGAKEKN